MATPLIPLPRVEWVENVPREVRGSVEPLLDAALDLTPRWLRKLLVFYDLKSETAAHVDMESDYGIAKLVIGPEFLECVDWERRQVVEHEMLHIAQSPMYAVFDDVMDHLKKHGDKAIAAVFAKQYDRATERTNCDLCDVLDRRRTGG